MYDKHALRANGGTIAAVVTYMSYALRTLLYTTLLSEKKHAMANKKTLPSDPEFLLQYLDDMDSDFSDEDFDGYVEENNEGCEVSGNDT